jgi:hypothetical protein
MQQIADWLDKLGLSEYAIQSLSEKFPANNAAGLLLNRCSVAGWYKLHIVAVYGRLDLFIPGDGGTSRPSALAVLRLIASSYLVGACTGRSEGFSPLRMRST